MKNKFLAVLLSAVVAFGLWMYVITVVSPESEETYYDIPVVLQNKNILEERELMIVSDAPNVTLVLKSDRTILNDLNESNINVITNLANIEKPGIHQLTYDISYPGNIPHNDVAVQSSSTDMITLRVENRVRKTVPVVVDYGNTTVPQGYISDLENAQLNYTNIEISGAESAIDQIEKAVINLDLSSQTKTLAGEFKYTLCDRFGVPVAMDFVTANTEKVSLMVKIQKVKEIELKLDIIEGGGATLENTTIEVDTTKIQISGSDTQLEDLNSLTVGTINLSDILEDKTLTFPIVLPEGVANQTGVEQVTVKIELPRLKTKELRITDISAINVPEGLQADIVTKALQVTVRGPSRLIDKITAENVSAVINLAEAQAGSVTLKAEIRVTEEFAGVGALDTYTVSANLHS